MASRRLVGSCTHARPSLVSSARVVVIRAIYTRPVTSTLHSNANSTTTPSSLLCNSTYYIQPPPQQRQYSARSMRKYRRQERVTIDTEKATATNAPTIKGHGTRVVIESPEQIAEQYAPPASLLNPVQWFRSSRHWLINQVSLFRMRKYMPTFKLYVRVCIELHVRRCSFAKQRALTVIGDHQEAMAEG
jgi:hypothetical protein